jgi:hypothetical protein
MINTKTTHRKLTVEATTGVFHSFHDTPPPYQILEISGSARADDEAPAAMMLAWSLWLPWPILGLAESAYGDDGAPAAMMLARQNDMQWYCVEQARSFNDLSIVIANGDYLHAKICFKITAASLCFQLMVRVGL